MRRLQPQQGLDVQVVIVVVRDEDQVNRWQVLEREAWVAYTLRSEVAKWTHALRIDRVGEHIQTPELQQERDVVDKGQRELAAAQVVWQSRFARVVHPLWPERTL